MKFLNLILFCLTLLAANTVFAKAEQVDDFHWTGVERVVAVGDLHGDYLQYIAVMESAGLIDKKGNWNGGKTHFVQTGDIPDRGPDTRKIIDHLVKLTKQAKKKGGRVHMLIGNHEAMNVTGDLRYVSPGEYEAFVTSNSARLRDLQWDRQVDWMRDNLPNFEELDLAAYREEWNTRVPLGWVEHRLAWGLEGEYGSLVGDHEVAVQINETIFLHGGISEKYCKFSLQSLTEQVVEALAVRDPAVVTIANDPMGPLWYRGLARQSETDEIYSQTLDNILNRYGASRIVVGHTPTGGVIWPRFDQRVIVNDTGIATHYGAHKGVLELNPEGVSAIYGDQKIPLPLKNDAREDYLRAVIELDSNNAQLKQRLAQMLAPTEVENVEPADADPDAGLQPAEEEILLEAATPGTCQ